ncbi:MAG: TadE/TadG family type IV pilus assembly protein [Alphaproteobacteria bacterium]
MKLRVHQDGGRSIRCFLQDDRGSATVEFVLMVPLFVMFLLLVTDASLLFLRQTTLMNITRDTARIVSRHAMTPDVAKTYAETKASTVNAPATATVTIDNGFVTVILSSEATSAAPFGLIKYAVGDKISAATITTMEPV